MELSCVVVVMKSWWCLVDSSGDELMVHSW